MQEHKRSHQVLLLPIDGVGFYAVQVLVVAQEYVAFLCETEADRTEVSKKHNDPAGFEIGAEVNHLQFFFQPELATAEDHLIGDWKVTRQRWAAPDHHGVDAVQELVAEEPVLLPVVLNIL